MVALAANNTSKPQSTASLAKCMDMPLPFMHQIAHTLMQSGLIRATPGPRGGLMLSRPSREISVLQVVESLEGNIALNPPQPQEDRCAQDESGSVQMVWDDLQQKIMLYLGGIYLDSLVGQVGYAYEFFSGSTISKEHSN